MSDFNQTSLFPKTEKELGQEREEAFLAETLPRLRKTAESKNADPDDITYEVLSSYTSIRFRSSVICRLKMRGKNWCVFVPRRLQETIPEDMKPDEVRTEPKYLKISFDVLGETGTFALMERATLLAIELVPKEFDCCSRFEACSDAGVCIHPDPSFSLLCGYRKILKSGRIFCGKNRNVE